MKVVIASNNQGKIKEFKEILSPMGYEILDLNVSLNEFEEIGSTFKENALLKAEFVYRKTGHLTIADDSGLCIRSLPDILGVYSARFMGETTNYQVKMRAILDLLKDKDDRSAYFKSVIAVVGDGVNLAFEGVCEGEISTEIRGDAGFGYDPIFIPKNYQKSFGELDESIKNQISHRFKALKQMMEYLNETKI